MEHFFRNSVYDKSMDMEKVLKVTIKAKGTLTLTSTGVSMLPNIKSRDRVLIKEKEQYKNGDVVLFLYEGQNLFIHRIVYLLRNRL